jgi:major membrane immunogen (membrane-anchored lipoprotein)
MQTRYSSKVSELIDVKSKNGTILFSKRIIKPDKYKVIDLSTVNNMYKNLREKKHERKQKIAIKVLCLDGWKTLVNYDYNEKEIDMQFIEYYRQMGDSVHILLHKVYESFILSKASFKPISTLHFAPNN